ncbi:MAG: chloride channel protein [Caulobacteraceae bacterium]|nr:chloride channel protein [Caulobacteraceae bacterium]
MAALRFEGFRRPQRGLRRWTGWLRARIRSSELWLVFIAAAVGALAGGLAMFQGALAHGLQVLLFGIEPEVRLSAAPPIAPVRLLALPAGGVVMGVLAWAWTRRRRSPPVDPVEANALRGGRMSLQDSAFVCLQTLISNGFGASVGLEAAYTQAGAAVASRLGVWLNLRRADLRVMVGAGAGAAIAAAFGAPLTGAFYAFEVVIGTYTVSSVAPVAAAALAAALVARASGETIYGMAPEAVGGTLTAAAYGLYAGLGLVCAVFGIGVMRLVAVMEGLVGRSPIPRWARPAVGGVVLIAFAAASPQTLSSGHGALRYDLEVDLGLKLVLVLLALKAAASIVSLGFGFRGGLFFASLFLGSLVGRVYAAGLAATHWPSAMLDPTVASLVGMSALAVAVIGGPLTMAFLALETTGDFGITAAALTASLFASVVARETFGYSFSTWRLHLRGETIRSAHDVGWLRNLTAGGMMRKASETISAAASVAEARRRFPLGSAKQVVVMDETGAYAGLVPVAALYVEPSDPARSVGALAQQADVALTPEMTIKEIMEAFDRTETDALAVVDPDGAPLGLVSEAYATRRYADELEKARRDLIGEN